MAFKLAEAFVRLFADPTDLKAGLKNAEKDTTAFTAKMKGGLLQLARLAFPAGIATGIIAAGRAAIDTADRMLELAQQTGLTTEELSRLQYGASTAGLDINGLNLGLRFLNRSMFEAKAGSEEAAAALAAVGVSAQDIKTKNPHEILLKIADAFSKNEQRGNKAALAMKIFGRSGAEMIPFLNEGSAGMAKFAKASDAAGYTISTKFAQDADRFNDNVQIMKNNVLGLARSFTADLLPAMNGFSSYLRGEFATTLDETKSKTNGFQDFVNATTAGFIVIAAGAKQAAAAAGFLVLSLTDIDEGALLEGYNLRLKEIADEAAAAILAITDPRAADSAAGSIDGLGNSVKGLKTELVELQYSKTLADVFKPIRESAEKTLEFQNEIGKEILAAMNEQELYERVVAQETFDKRKALIMQLIDVHGEKAGLITQNEEWLKARLLQIDLEYAKDFGNILKRIERDYGTHTQNLEGMLYNFATSAERGLDDAFFSAIKGDTEGVKDAFKSMLDSMLREITAFLAKKAVMKLLEILATYYGGGTASSSGAIVGSITDSTTTGFANGGIVPGGFKAFASGGVISQPTLGLVGEGRYPEAVVPLPDGKTIPVIMQNAGGNQPIVIDQTIMLAPDPRVMRPSDVISIVSGDIYAGGQIRRAIRARG